MDFYFTEGSDIFYVFKPGRLSMLISQFQNFFHYFYPSYYLFK
jgi:hypothetical protein